MKYIYVDNSNLWLGGGSLAAVKQGPASDVRQVTNAQRIQAGWRIDYDKLYKVLSAGDSSLVKSTKLWGSEPPSAPFWNTVENAGF